MKITSILFVLFCIFQLCFWTAAVVIFLFVPYYGLRLGTIGADSVARGLGKSVEADRCGEKMNVTFSTITIAEMRSIAQFFAGLDVLECLIRVNGVVIGELIQTQSERKEKIFGLF